MASLCGFRGTVPTAAWVLSMIAFSVIGFMSAWSQFKWIATDTLLGDNGYGGVFTTGEALSQAISSAISVGLCCPTVPYVVVMICLGVGLLAAKP